MGKTPRKTQDRMAYKKSWRATERSRKRHNAFIVEYIRIKFENVYNEASSFFNGLSSIHPQKLDLRRTKEFKEWKEAIKNAQDPEDHIIAQILRTDVTYGEKPTTSKNQRGKTNNESNNEEKPNDTDSDTETISCDEQKQDESSTELDNESDTETNNDEQNYHDGMLLEIPLENYLHTPHHDQNTQAIDAEQPDNHEYEVFSDERIQEIVAELRNDPELGAIFADPENTDQEDEGVELPTLEEEIELDFEPFDYRLEVELENW